MEETQRPARVKLRACESDQMGRVALTAGRSDLMGLCYNAVELYEELCVDTAKTPH